MSKDKENDVQGKPQDTNESESTNDSEIRRKKLIDQIRSLQLLTSNIECSLNTTKLNELGDKDISIGLNHHRENNDSIDIDVAISNELFSQTGLYCKKISNLFVFGFQSWDDGRWANHYWIELYNDNEKWELRRWFMPLSLKVRNMFSKYPMDTPGNVTLFLKACKCQVDCYNRRKQQYKELEAFMNAAGYVCSIEKDMRFMIITIRLTKEIDKYATVVKLIYISLYYKTDETRPSKLSVGCDFMKLSNEETNKLEHYFRRFKNLDLKAAAEKILMSEESISMWRKIEQNEVFEGDVESGTDSENSLTQMLAEIDTMAKARRKRKKKVKNTKHSQNESISMIQHEDPSQVESTSKHSDRKKNKLTESKEGTNTKFNVSRNKQIRKSFVKPSSKKNALIKDSNENIKNYLLKPATSNGQSKVGKKNAQALCSTPLSGKNVMLSKITEEISEIGSESMNEHNESVDKAERNSRRKSQTYQSFDSDVSDEEHSSEQMELLKDLRNAKRKYDLEKQSSKENGQKTSTKFKKMRK